MNEWNIQSRSHACQMCQKPFTDKGHFHTVLVASKQELLRQDVCVDCWNTKFAQGHADRKGFISHWQGVYQAPAVGPTEPIQKETAESLLRRLIEANDPKHGPACYILAVMLERKRLLRIKEQIHRDGNRIFIYEHPKTGDIFTIKDPDLQLNQLESVQRDVADLLAHGYTPSPEASVQPAPSESSAPPSDSLFPMPSAPVQEPPEEPSTVQPIGEEPVIVQPTELSPDAQPAGEQPENNSPAAEQPAHNQSVVEQPAGEQPEREPSPPVSDSNASKNE